MTDEAVQPYDQRRANRARIAAWALVAVAVLMIVAVATAAVLVRG